MSREEIEQLRALMQRHSVRYGDFTLASGNKSKYYYNGKRVTLRPSAMRLIGEALVDVVLASGAEAVGGPELGAVPIACAVGIASLSRGRDLPVFVVRKEQKQYGARVAIVEDAITTGGSVQKAIDAVEAAGAKVVLLVVLVERHEGGGDGLRSQGYEVLSVFRTDEEGQLSVNPEFERRLASAQAAAKRG